MLVNGQIFYNTDLTERLDFMKSADCQSSVIVNQQDVTKAFKELLTVPADCICFHGSMKSMGWVEGAFQAVFDGILEAASPGGTIAIPTLWYDGTPGRDNPKNFDLENSTAYNGALAEQFRKDPRSMRSNHFSHSLSAMGARAEELTKDHGLAGFFPSPWSEKAFAVVSPWQRLYDWNCLYAFIGVDFNVCTMKHFIESRLINYYLSLISDSAERFAKRCELSYERDAKIWPFISGNMMQVSVEKYGLVTKAKLGNADLLAVRCRPLVEIVIQDCKNNPADWYKEDFYSWCQSIPGAIN